MKSKFTIGLCVSVAALLSACSNHKNSHPEPLPVMVKNPHSVDSQQVKEDIDANCYYGSNPPPLSTSPEKNDKYLDMQYIAFKVLPNGMTQRMIANPTVQQQLDTALAENRFADWIDILENARGFVVRPDNQANVTIGNRLNRNPDPLDFDLSWYTKLAFVVIGQNVSFDQDPFEVASGGLQSPFYGPAQFYRNNQMIMVDYLSLPNHGDYGWDTITPRDCIYTYELNLTGSRNGNVRGQPTTFSTKIIIDPGGSNNGGPDIGEPPGGDGWP